MLPLAQLNSLHDGRCRSVWNTAKCRTWSHRQRTTLASILRTVRWYSQISIPLSWKTGYWKPTSHEGLDSCHYCDDIFSAVTKTKTTSLLLTFISFITNRQFCGDLIRLDVHLPPLWLKTKVIIVCFILISIYAEGNIDQYRIFRNRLSNDSVRTFKW